PGNHDFNIDGCRSYFDDTPHGENTVSGPEFCEIYADYGYGNALSRDEESYSYISEINDKLWAVMLDTTLCKYNEEVGLNTMGGVIWDETLEWLRPYLEEAKEKGITVIGFSHHNLFVHNERFTDNYVMYDSESLEALYKEYGVKLHLSGHMHIQHIASKDGIYDIAQGGLLDYGNRISRIDVYDNCMEYSRIQIGDISDYSIGVFCDKYMGKNLSRYEEMYGDKAEEVHLLASLLNAYYFDGDYVRINETLRQRSEAVTLLKKNEKDSYLETILKVENKDQNYLLIKK
ncbi:MAG: metallophosphoesterase, partial [Firmicutes bacterium]|nr:metallophosphoesterase [Bacillota bacterium]